MNRHHLIAAAIGASIFFTFTGGQASAAANTSTVTQNSSQYTVKPGDTLFNIAVRHKLSASQIKLWNHLATDSILVGQKLTLKEIGAQQAVPKSIAVLSPSVKKMSPESIANAIMTEAKKYIGTPYLWGGNTISGFDCSGYLKYVFAKVGISIPRTAATIWNATNAVAQPKPGDMVFFETYTTGPSHLGIYLGSNKFIHACDSGVKISDLNFSFWKARYLGAKTIF